MKDYLHFKIDGMDCAEEVAVLKKELGAIVGGEGQRSRCQTGKEPGQHG